MGGIKCFLYHQIGNCNPAGVEINPGWYALLGAILGLSVEEALHKICKTPIWWGTHPLLQTEKRMHTGVDR